MPIYPTRKDLPGRCNAAALILPLGKRGCDWVDAGAYVCMDGSSVWTHIQLRLGEKCLRGASVIRV